MESIPSPLDEFVKMQKMEETLYEVSNGKEYNKSHKNDFPNMSVGRGRGQMLKVESASKSMDEFDPMKEDFNNDSFNSYTKGPGALIKYSNQVNKRRSKEGSRYYKLHVSNVPCALNENAIRYLFQNYGEVQSVYLRVRGEGETNWSFVEYERIDEAQRAIEGLNKKPPHNMYVKFSRETVEKVDNKNPGFNEVIQQPLPQDEPVTPPCGAGRGCRLPMAGRSPQSYNLNRQKADVYHNESLKNGHSEKKFNLYDPPESVVISNEVIAKNVDHVNAKGGMGRGLSNTTNVIKERKPRIPEFTAEQEQLIENWVDDVNFYGQNEEDVFNDGSQLPFCPGRCQHCHKPALQLCSVCKAWYCGNDCIKADWVKHQLVCNPRTAEFAQDGHLKYTRIYSDNETRLKKVSNHFRPKENDSSSTDSGPTKTLNHHRNSNASTKNKTTSNKGSCSDLSQSGRSDLNKSKEKIHRNRNALKKPDVFIKKETEQHNTINVLPFPNDKFTSVVCTWVEEPYYWVFMEDNMDLLNGIINTLEEHCNDPQVVSDPTLKNKCCALFEGAWYRAKILSKTSTSVKVYFVDYGNEGEIKLDEMKALPQKLNTIKPQARKIKFVEGTKTNLNASTDITVKIKAIKMDDDDGACIVQLEGGPEMIQNSNPLKIIQEPKPLKMLLPSDKFTTVKIMSAEKDDEYWVILEDRLLELCSLTDSFNSCGSLTVTISVPVMNELYLASYDDIWCRAKVTKLNPLTVFYIDYGNSSTYKTENLRPLPISFRDISPMAMNIKLAKGTPQKYFKLDAPSTLKVKAVKPSGEAIIVHVEGVSYTEELEDVQRRMPNLNQPAKKKCNHVLYLTDENATGVVIQVQRIMGENCLTGTIALTDETTTSPLYMTNDDITQKLENTKADTKFKPSLSDPVCALVDGSWYRAYVMTKRTDEIKVALVDVGVVMVPDALAPMSQEIALIAEAGVRCIFPSPLKDISKMAGEQFSITNIKKETGKLIGEIASYGKVTIAPWEPIYEDGGLAACKLKSGMRVQISSFHAPNAVYLRSMEPEDLIKFNELVQDIGRYSDKAPLLIRKPLCGELVSCKWLDDQMYYRAQVFKKKGDNYQVIFVDFGNIETVSVADMKPLNDSFKAVPCFAVKVGLKGIPGSAFNRTAVQILNTKLDQTLTLTAVFEEHHLHEVRLFAGPRDLNLLIESAMTPSWLSEDKSDSILFMGDDVTHDKWLPGQKISFEPVHFIEFNELLVVDRDSTVLAHVVEVLTSRITEYCNTHSSPYNPRINEVCLALYREDNTALWYRALCLSTLENMSTVFFIDFGNHGDVFHKDIRKIPVDFMEHPAALKKCKIYGLSNSLPDPVKQQIKDLEGTVTEGSCIYVTDDQTSLIYIPKINEILTENGLPPVNPPPIPTPPSS